MVRGMTNRLKGCPMSQAAIEQTRRWIDRVVVGLQLCPFATGPHRDGTIHYACSAAGEDAYAVLTELWMEIERLKETPTIETTVLILPEGWGDFDAYLDLFAAAEDLLVRGGFSLDFQVVSFHPDYRFADAAPDDPANATNRSPLPLIHILREASLTQAIDSHPDTAQIPERNIQRLRELGHAGLRAVLDAETSITNP